MMIKRYILGFLLHLANRDVDLITKDKFYPIKNRILLKYGTRVGEEIQHIRKECHSCDATGIYRSEYKPKETCWSCDGTGIYEQYWTRLDKYKLGKWYFHNPTKRQYEYEPLFEGVALPVIKGYIHHDRPKYRLGREAMLWLFLIYDRPAYKKMLGSVGYCGNIRTPLVLIHSIAFKIKQFDWEDFKDELKTKFKPKQKPTVYESEDWLPF